MEKKAQTPGRPRPRLIRSEYIIRLEEKRYKQKNIKVVYNAINEYITLEKFSMYPQDNNNYYYLREKKDLEFLIKKMFLKLKIKNKTELNNFLNSSAVQHLTVISILDLIGNN